MAARLLLLCHAPTASARHAGFPADDEPLEPSAAARLAALRDHLPRADRCLVSPARRARETAAGLGLDARAEPSLADGDFGRWRGLALRDVQEREPQAVAHWLQDPSAAPHGGESIETLIARLVAWLADQASSRGATLAVTHAAVIRAALVAALGAEPRAFWRIDVAPLALARLSGHANRWNLVGLGPLDAEL